MLPVCVTDNSTIIFRGSNIDSLMCLIAVSL